MSVLRRFAKTLGLTAVEAETASPSFLCRATATGGTLSPSSGFATNCFPRRSRRTWSWTGIIGPRSFQEVMKKFESAGIRGHVWGA